MLDTYDIFRLLHPMIGASFVLPLIGIVTYFSVQTRQRRLATAAKEKTKIAPVVGQEHVKLGKVMTTAVVALTLLGLVHPIVKNLRNSNALVEDPIKVAFIGLLFAFTVASLVFLYRTRTALWRGVFATLCGMGVVILGCQDGVFRRTYEWYLSHYYFGIAVTLLMIFSLAVLPDVYKSKKWRIAHAALNTVAVLLFISQGITGTRDLLELPLHWQESYVYSCDYVNKTCN